MSKLRLGFKAVAYTKATRLRNRDRLQHIYVIHRDGVIGYIGKTCHPIRRLGEHFWPSCQVYYKEGHLEWLLAGDLKCIISWPMSNKEAYRLEKRLIMQYGPLFNRDYNWYN